MNTKVFAALVCLAVFAAAIDVKDEFDKFQAKYNKAYKTPEEYQHRFRVFQTNLKIAKVHEIANKGSAQFGVTKFMDLSPEEFASMYLNFDPTNFTRPAPKDFTKAQKPWPNVAAPDPTNYDWSAAGCITDVYNQGQCGSCWAFSATETVESYFALGGGSLTELSMQQIVDCDTGGQDQGCNGGFPSGAYQYIEGAGGLDALSCYPYTAEDGSCASSSCTPVATVTNYNSISGESGMYSQMSSSSGGPVSVCVDASSWQYYNGGILTSCGTSVDHCVQATGYGDYGGSGAYWNVRNSWGGDWGEEGYIWVAIGQDLCAIGDYATVVSASAA